MRDLCINMNNHKKSTFHLLGNFLNPALTLPEDCCVAPTLLGQSLIKPPIRQKLNFDNHPYLCKDLYE